MQGRGGHGEEWVGKYGCREEWVGVGGVGVRRSRGGRSGCKEK